MRSGAEKYAKFAYSSRYAFSVELDERAYDKGAFDGALALSDDNRHYRVREQNDVARLAGNVLYAEWHPWRDVKVDTWLLPTSPWHIRVHRITTPRELHTTEGGFAGARADLITDTLIEEPNRAIVRTPTDVSAIADLGSSALRASRAHKALPNTNLIVARTLVPQLRGSIPAGVTILATAAMALPPSIADAALASPPSMPDLAALEALAQSGVDVSALQVPERF